MEISVAVTDTSQRGVDGIDCVFLEREVADFD